MYKAVLCCVALVGLIATGCTPKGAARLPTNKVTGKVTLSGAPVAGASVAFSPVTTGNPPALGVTDTQGVYVLTTYDAGDGAVAGDYKIMVSKTAPSTGGPAGEPAHDPTGQSKAPSAPQHAGPKGAGQGPSSLLPEKYSKADSTPLTKTVNEGDNTIDIEL